MPGLLERAIRISERKSGGIQPGGPDSAVGDASGVTPAERAEMLSSIERLFTERRPLDSLAEKSHRRSGAAFPILVNLVAFVLLAGAVFGIRLVSLGFGEGGTASPGHYLTTEGLVVKAVKQQAAVQLNEREARIAQIKRELAALRQTISESPGGVANARRKQLEAELANLQSAASVRLSKLTAQRDQQLFLIRQLQGIYQDIGADISANHLQKAISAISSANDLLDTSANNHEGEMALIAPAMRTGNVVLRDALIYGQTAAQANSDSHLQAQLAEIKLLVHRGDQQYQKGDRQGAAALYAKAVTSIASIAHAYDRLNGMSQGSFNRKGAALTARIDELQKRVAALQSLANAQEATLRGQGNRLSRQQKQIADQAGQIGQQQLQIQKQTEQLATVVNSLQQSIARSASESASNGPQSSGSQAGPNVVDLLKTKIAIRRLADSPEARKAYPDLYRELDAFFAEYGKAYSDRGRQSALDEVALALRTIMASLNLSIQSAPSVSAPPATGQLSDKQRPPTIQQGAATAYLDSVQGALSALYRRID